MLPCSFACRAGYGTHRALDTLQRDLRGGTWVLKVDVSKYFYSIDHDILRTGLARRIACRRTLALVDQVLATYSAHDEYYFPQSGDDLWSSSRPRGVPIGNLTSQLFANWYLAALDTFVKRTLGWRRYVRYMDDLVFVGPSREAMADVRDAVCQQLTVLRLTPHPRKTQLFPVHHGVRFLGFRVYPHHRRLLRANVARFNQRMRRYRRAVAAGAMSFEEVRLSLASFMGFAGDEAVPIMNRLLDVHAFAVPGKALPQRFLVGTDR
jgi:retron-type reverse transcriptase